MGNFRDQMRKGRAVIHQKMGDGAIIFAWPPEDGESVEILASVNVRVHEKFLMEGDLKGTNYHYAEVEANAPVAVFWREEFVPVRGLFFLTEYGRGYMIDHALDPDDQTQNAKVTELLDIDMVGWPEYITPEELARRNA